MDGYPIVNFVNYPLSCKVRKKYQNFQKIIGKKETNSQKITPMINVT